MAKKKVSYQNLLKEAISEFDTSKTVDVKGPMLDPILKWDGDGLLKWSITKTVLKNKVRKWTM
jgi:hypothetical protein